MASPSRSPIRGSLGSVLVVVALLGGALAGCTTPAAAFAVVGLEVPPDGTEVVTGDDVVVTARVENTGNAAGTYEASMTVDGTVRANEDVALEPGESRTVTFTTTAGPPGDHQVSVGSATATIHVIGAPHFTVEAFAISSDPGAIVPESQVQLTGRLANDGTLAGAYDVEFAIDGVVQERASIDLDVGERESLAYTIEAGPPGAYTLTLGDARLTMTVFAPASFEVTDLTLDPNPARTGKTVNALVSVANLGGVAGTYEVKVSMDGKSAATQEVTIGGGGQTTLEIPLKVPSGRRHTVDVNGVEAKLVAWKITRPTNGKILVNTLKGGRGQLTIENGDERDAVVVLAKSSNPSKARLAVYLRAGKSRTIKGIKDGTFVVYYTHGKGWDAYTRAFTSEPDLRRFEETIRFKTTRTATMITYSIWTLTLHAVVGGNAPTDPVGDQDFPAVP